MIAVDEQNKVCLQWFHSQAYQFWPGGAFK
jgi:hypothetical protein